jgi:hypothetical protein
MIKTNETPLTVGKLKEVLAQVPDDVLVRIVSDSTEVDDLITDGAMFVDLPELTFPKREFWITINY